MTLLRFSDPHCAGDNGYRVGKEVLEGIGGISAW
jgi:hypothetical protein